MIGAGLEVGVDPRADLVDVAPGHNVVHQSIAARARDVLVRVAQPPQVVHVVGQAEVVKRMDAGDGPSPIWVRLQHHGLLRREQRLWTKHSAGHARVLDRHEVRMRSPGALGRQLQHVWPERGEDGHRLFRRFHRLVWGFRHGIEVGAHGGHRLAINVASHLFDAWLVADSDAEQEAVRVRFRERLLRRRHGHSVAGVDVGDPSRHDNPAGSGQQQTGVAEGLAPQRLGEPDGRVAQPLQLADGLLRLRGGLVVEGAGPDADAAEFHQRSS